MCTEPQNYNTMEPVLESSVCLICFQMTEEHIFVPSDAPEKLFNNCNKYLHSTLTKGTLNDIQLPNENQVPLCKSCFDSALELTQLSEQLTTIQKDISDLSEAFSTAVFQRRSQVYSIGQSCKTSSIVKFNEACLPPNLFSMKLGVGIQNIHPNKNNDDMNINGLHLQTDISNVKCEASDIKFDNLSENPQKLDASDDIEIQFNKQNLDNQCGQSTIEQNLNLTSLSEMKIFQVACRNDSIKRTDPKNGVKLTMSDLMESVTMPKIILERIKIEGHEFGVSVVNSSQTNCESGQHNIDRTLLKDEEFPDNSLSLKSPEDGRQLKCFYCEKTFAEECHRTLHHTTHKGDNIKNQKICQKTPTVKNIFHKCSYCEKVFSKPTNLQVHERLHTGEKPFKCSLCSARFSQSNNLQCHERIHTGVKPYKCSFCNNRFKQQEHLKRHERIHTGEKPFKCSYCGTAFTHKTTLRDHERIHTGEKPFKCSFCNTRCITKSNLRYHERTHTGEKPFKCSFCSTGYNNKSNLKAHERTHTGEKPFKCSFCGKCFREKYLLKVHQRLHTEEKPYKCLYCKKTFSQRSDKNFHQKGHREQMLSDGTQNDVALAHLKHGEKMNSTDLTEMAFSHDEERAHQENIDRREDEIVNENVIVGI